MAKEKKKVTRIMKVTMDEEEFRKFDSGETHSDKGIRTDKGYLSALPDIEDITEDEMPQRVPTEQEIRYLANFQKSTGDIIAEQIITGFGKVISGIINDPIIQEDLKLYATSWWQYKVRPKIIMASDRMKESAHKGYRSVSKRIYHSKEIDYEYQIQMINPDNETYVVTGEEAKVIIEETKQKARELSALIYLLSNICIKDDLTDDEYSLEQAYIKQLVSQEALFTMKFLTSNKGFIDNETAITFNDFLKGYLRHDKELIPIPLIEDQY